jgi:hypothetical protein
MVPAPPPAAAGDAGPLWLVVQAGGARLALPLDAVEETSHRLPHEPLPVPGAASWLAGLIA